MVMVKLANRALVTGGADFIGSHLIDELLSKDFDVVVLDDFSKGRRENLSLHFGKPSFCLVAGYARDKANVKKALEGVDVVFHLAAIVSVDFSVKNPWLTRRTLTGLFEVYGFETVCLRFFNVYGPRQVSESYSGVIKKFVNRLKHREEPIIHGDGEQTRDFAFVRDVVDACMRAMHRKNCVGEVINTGTGVETSTNKLASLLAELFNLRNIKFVYAEPPAGDIRRSCADLSKAERVFGYEPKVTLEVELNALLMEKQKGL
jgi:nucleoside-diphosphate-sugar epimerase